MSILLTKLFRREFFRTAVVSNTEDIAGSFRRVSLFGEDLKDEAWSRGNKVRFHLNGSTSRTHTPTLWDSHRGIAQFTFFLHGNGPGSVWAASLKKGDLCRVSAPKACLEFGAMKGPTIFFWR